jgi:hypothetical protein
MNNKKEGTPEIKTKSKPSPRTKGNNDSARKYLRQKYNKTIPFRKNSYDRSTQSAYQTKFQQQSKSSQKSKPLPLWIERDSRIGNQLRILPDSVSASSDEFIGTT